MSTVSGDSQEPALLSALRRPEPAPPGWWTPGVTCQGPEGHWNVAGIWGPVLPQPRQGLPSLGLSSPPLLIWCCR